MKIIKKSVLLLGVIMLSSTVTKIFGQFRRQPTGSHFSNVAGASNSLMTTYANLFYGPPEKKEPRPQYKRWVKDLERLEDYVYANVKDNNKLMSAVRAIRKVGLDLADKFEFRREVKFSKKELAPDFQDLKKAKKGLESFISWFWGKKEKEIKELLLGIIDTLEEGIKIMTV